MATTYENPAYPHKVAITRKSVSGMPPTVTITPVWSGDCDCQIGANGQTQLRDEVYVSDYAIYTRCIDTDLATGDTVTVTLKEGAVPIPCTLEQFSNDLVWVEDDIPYGTTMWVNRIRQ